MKTFIISLLSLCLLNISFPLKALVASQNQDELKRISAMIVQWKPKTEILAAWESHVRRNPKLDIDKTISTIITSARQENKKVITDTNNYRKAESVITDLQRQMHENAKKILDNLKG